MRLLRLVVKVYPEGGATVECSDHVQTPHSQSLGNTYINRAIVVQILGELGEVEQGGILEGCEIQANRIEEVELFIADTEQARSKLGLYQKGAIVER